MGKWFLRCPKDGEYEGNCTFSKHGKAFVLLCPKGIKTLKPGCDVEDNYTHRTMHRD